MPAQIPCFINPQSGPVGVYVGKRKVYVAPFEDLGTRLERANSIYVLEGEEHAALAAPFGPLAPFSDTPENIAKVANCVRLHGCQAVLSAADRAVASAAVAGPAVVAGVGDVGGATDEVPQLDAANPADLEVETPDSETETAEVEAISDEVAETAEVAEVIDARPVARIADDRAAKQPRRSRNS